MALTDKVLSHTDELDRAQYKKLSNCQGAQVMGTSSPSILMNEFNPWQVKRSYSLKRLNVELGALPWRTHLQVQNKVALRCSTEQARKGETSKGQGGQSKSYWPTSQQIKKELSHELH